MSAPGLENAHLLVVDDDERLRALLQRYLTQNGLRVSVAANAEEARALMKSMAFDLLVLDVMMPGESGLDLTRFVRTHSQVPILMLTARGEPQDRVRGLEIGVDDYLGKPFEPRELLLRIGSVLRRTRAAPIGGQEIAVVRFGRFVFSLERGELRAGDEVVRITEREREMLRLLSVNAGATVSREALSGSGGAAQERTVDVLINRLRRKIEHDPANPIYLQTARGAGVGIQTQLSDGWSALSITGAGTMAFCDSRRSPICSCRAAKTEGTVEPGVLSGSQTSVKS